MDFKTICKNLMAVALIFSLSSAPIQFAQADAPSETNQEYVKRIKEINALKASSKHVEALQLAEKLLKNNPFSTDLRDLLSELYLATGNYEKSLVHAESSFRMNAKNERAHELKARNLFLLKRWRDFFDFVEGLESPSHAVLILKSKSLCETNNVEDAKKIISDKQNALSGNFEYFELLGDIDVKSGNFSSAYKNYRTGFELNPKVSEIQYKMGVALLLSKRFDEAVGVFAHLSDQHPQSKKCKFQYLTALAMKERWDMAGDLLSKWHKSSPTNDWYALSYVRLLSFIGENDLAKKVLESHLKKTEPSTEALDLKFAIGNPAADTELKISAYRASASVSRHPAQAEGIFIVKKDDSIAGISKQVYGSYRYWPRIIQANAPIDPMKLKVGSRIILPHDLVAVAEKSVEEQNSRNQFLKILGREPSNEGPLLALAVVGPNSEISASIEDEPVASATKKLSFSLSAGPYSQNLQMQSSTLNANLSRKTGAQVSAGGKYAFGDSNFFLHSDLTFQKATYEGVAGYSPSSLDVTQYGLRGFGGYALLSQDKVNLNLLAGWNYHERSLPQTSPNVVLSSYKSSGPMLGFTGEMKISDRWTLFGAGYGSTIINHDEKSSSSGKFSSGHRFDVGAGISYAVSTNYEFFAGAQYLAEEIQFSGTGQRGLQNIKERADAMAFPIGFRTRFGR